MRKYHRLVAGCISLLVIASLLLVSSRFLPRQTGERHYRSGIAETGADRQLAHWFQARAYPDPSHLQEKYRLAWEQFQSFRNDPRHQVARITAANWTSLGPSTTIGGRILCVAVTPGNSNLLWAGSASGGIWKSTNAGSSWTPVVTNFPLLGVSSILVHPTNPNILYAGTGEVYRTDTSNIGFNVWKARGTYGVGIIKSTDGGVTWTSVFSKNTSALFGIQMLAFDPTNANTLFACATDGLYRSTDSGATWNRILAKTYVSDVAVNPSNNNQIVVGVGNLVNADKGIYRTTNGTNASPTWTKITSALPASFNGFIRLDNAGSSRLVASIGRADNSSLQELYLSTDFGATWVAKSSSSHTQYQYWFSHDVAVNPANTNQFIMGGVPLYRYTSSSTTSGTGTRTQIGTNVHADIHDVLFDPNNSNTIYVATDGGIYKSTNGGSSFSSINNGLAATQFYASFATHPTDANTMIGGLQDNGVVRFNGSTWTTVFGGDGGPCAIAPNGNTVLASNDARGVRRSTAGVSGTFSSVLSSWAFVADDRTAFMAPLAISASNPNIMYSGTDNMHISTNGGSSWTNSSYSTATSYIEQNRKTAITLAISPVNQNKVYVSTSPFAQNTTNDYIWVNGLPNVMKTTTPTVFPYTSIKGNLPDRFVMDFAISPTNDDSVFVVLGGFGTSHVFVTGNGGASWQDRGAGLPDVPFNAILIDRVDPNILYAGCDFGVFVSPDRGNTWLDYNTGFWDATLVMDLQMTADNRLVAATHGKGVFRSDRYTGTLPRMLTQFDGYREAGCNRLFWSTQVENGVNRYELERSLDGTQYRLLSAFTAGNGGLDRNYLYVDPLPAGSTTQYYRIRIIQAGMADRYSQVVQLGNPKALTDIHIAGNPFRDKVQVQIGTDNTTAILFTLYSGNGQLIRRQQFEVTPGQNTLFLDGLSGIPRGSYVLEAVWEGQRQTWKLLKQ